ncbi:MAG: hypothetical protein BroJett031_32710 [Betaproteobacteria bacterium]|nr:MAG: hypothetical protein BroJett031_32710 [Betaproteobacteria bacterium]
MHGPLAFVLLWAAGLAVGVALALLLTGSGAAWIAVGLLAIVGFAATVLLMRRRR